MFALIMQNQILQRNTDEQPQCKDKTIVRNLIVFFRVFGTVKSRLWAQVKDSGKSVMSGGNTRTCNMHNSCHRLHLPGKERVGPVGSVLKNCH